MSALLGASLRGDADNNHDICIPYVGRFHKDLVLVIRMRFCDQKTDDFERGSFCDQKKETTLKEEIVQLFQKFPF